MIRRSPALDAIVRSVIFPCGFLLLAGSAATPLGAAPAQADPDSTFSIKTTDARWLDSVPSIYLAAAFGCTGGNTSPALEWKGAPAGTKSFALTLFDPDERSTPSGWWHWVVYNLPSSTHSLPQGAGVENSKVLPPHTQQGRTDLGNDAYHGPCPAQGDPPHRYTITLYALNVDTLPVPAEASGAMVTSIAQEHLLKQALFIGHYGR